MPIVSEGIAYTEHQYESLLLNYTVLDDKGTYMKEITSGIAEQLSRPSPGLGLPGSEPKLRLELALFPCSCLPPVGLTRLHLHRYLCTQIEGLT